jgi:hypothetical protein
VGVNLCLVLNSARGQFEGVDRPAQIGLSILAAEGESFANRRFVHLDHRDARPFQISNFPAKRKRELATGILTRLIVADE